MNLVCRFSWCRHMELWMIPEVIFVFILCYSVLVMYVNICVWLHFLFWRADWGNVQGGHCCFTVYTQATLIWNYRMVLFLRKGNNREYIWVILHTSQLFKPLNYIFWIFILLLWNSKMALIKSYNILKDQSLVAL